MFILLFIYWFRLWSLMTIKACICDGAYFFTLYYKYMYIVFIFQGNLALITIVQISINAYLYAFIHFFYNCFTIVILHAAKKKNPLLLKILSFKSATSKWHIAGDQVKKSWPNNLWSAKKNLIGSNLNNMIMFDQKQTNKNILSKINEAECSDRTTTHFLDEANQVK